MSQKPGSEDGDESLKVMIFTIITIVLIVAFLLMYIDYINAFIGGVTILHVYPFAMAVRYAPGILEIPFIGGWLFYPAALAHDLLVDGGYARMNGEVRQVILIAGGRVSLVIYGPLIFWMIFRMGTFRVDQKYKRRHSLESMIHEQSETWMTTRMFRAINPLKKGEVTARAVAESISRKKGAIDARGSGACPQGYLSFSPGSWHRALRPEEWLVARGVTFDQSRFSELTAEDVASEMSDFVFKKKWEDLDIETISEVLSEQLRTPWTGPETLRPYLKAIYAVMALFYDYKVNEANAILQDLGILAEHATRNRMSMDDMILRERGFLPRIEKIIKSSSGRSMAKIGAGHAWLESAFPAMLEKARLDRGILASPAFIWLKTEDRMMWYILNSVGVDTITVEAAGAIAHSKAETQLEKPIRRPAVYQAARGILEDYLDVIPERVRARREKDVRTRSPGAQIDRLLRDNDGDPTE